MRPLLKNRPVLLALGFGFLSLLLAWGFLKGREARLNAMEEPVAVLVADRDILEGTRLDAALLREVRVPRRFLQPKAATRFDAVAGWIATAPILRGEQILETKLTALSRITGLAAKIPQGMRALSMEVDDASGVGGLVRPGNFVDILGTFEVEESIDAVHVTTQMMAQNVPVLAVEDDLGSKALLENIAKNNARKNIFSGGAFAASIGPSKKTVTLCVTPRQAQSIEFAKTQGRISLALRPLSEEEPLSLNPTTLFDVLGFKGQVRGRGYREYRGK